MIVIMGHAKTGPGEIDRLTGGLQAMITATLQEDGCEHYCFSRDLCDPDRMIITERWRDQKALDGHFASPHMAAFNALLATAQMVDVSVKAYENGSVRTLVGRD